MKTSTKTTIGLLLAAIVVAVAAMIHGARRFEWSWFYPWVVSPYVALGLIFCLTPVRSKAQSLASCVAAALVLVSTCVIYIDAMWYSGSSTAGLVFVFTPIYLFVGGLVVWWLAWFVLARQFAEDP